MEANLSAQILPALYGCCDRPENWRPLLDRICADLGVRSAAVQIYRQEGGHLIQRWQERDSYSHANAALHDRWINNPDNPRLAIIPRDRLEAQLSVRTDAQRFDSTSPQLQETRHRLAQIGLRGGSGLLFEFEPSRWFSLILHRQISDTVERDGKDAAFLSDIAPHLLALSRVSATVQTARAAQATLASIMDRLRPGVILCTASGEVRWHNRAAATMLANGAPLMLDHGQLRGVSAESRQRLARLLSPPCDDDMITAAFGDLDDSMVQAIALPNGAFKGTVAHGWDDDRDGVALILIDPSQAPFLSAGHVTSLFGLTPAEARLAVALSQGTSLNAYADRRGVSVGTVRIQMKRILEKTDSRRQADLVGKLYGSVIAQVHGNLH
ncbi:helix-turn-helix transcriptional regulator [Sphingobium sp. ZW T5_29]|uniref:helix-turn-helix transcriptional regulator n=1 Tax=Sphingobium sp. ZW T5_29 TaxID=3378077 RepID=UPI0038533913